MQSLNHVSMKKLNEAFSNISKPRVVDMSKKELHVAKLSVHIRQLECDNLLISTIFQTVDSVPANVVITEKHFHLIFLLL